MSFIAQAMGLKDFPVLFLMFLGLVCVRSHSQNNLLCTWSIVLKDEIWLYDLATFILHKNWYRCMHSHNKTRHFAALWKFTWHHNLFLFSYSIYRKENVKTDTCCICEGIRIPMPLLLNCVFQVSMYNSCSSQRITHCFHQHNLRPN